MKERENKRECGYTHTEIQADRYIHRQTDRK